MEMIRGKPELGDFDGLLERATEVAQQILRISSENKNIVVIGHHDADGQTSAGIIGKFILRKKGRAIVRVVDELSSGTLSRISEGGFDFHILCDLGAGLSSEIREVFGDKWLAIDHHQIPQEEMHDDRVFNAWQFRYDGGREISSAGLCYFVAYCGDASEIDLSYLAVVGALGDRQDSFEQRSLSGLNKKVVEDAISVRRLVVTRDLVLYGRETKPIHEALASTTNPFIPGLTGNKDACLATLRSVGLELKSGQKWRTIAELSDEEKKRVMDSIIPHLAPTFDAEKAVGQLIGEVYTLEKEDEYTPLRDGREFATVLNSCGRMKRPGIGILLCFGDRNEALHEAEKTLSEYRQVLSKSIQTIIGNEERLIEKSRYVMVVGDGLVEEQMTGAVSSMLSSVPKFASKILLVRTTTAEGDLKFSARCTPGTDYINLGELMRASAKASEGIGGGHTMAAGARVPALRLQEFLRTVEDKLLQTPKHQIA
jgi:single-stranded-DNA-specific exonuclease